MPRIAREILGYLNDHPDAQDGFEGIIEWWLLERSIVHRIAAVRQAVSELIDRGLLIERKRPDGTTRYRLAPNKEDEIRRIVGGQLHE